MTVRGTEPIEDETGLLSIALDPNRLPMLRCAPQIADPVGELHAPDGLGLTLYANQAICHSVRLGKIFELGERLHTVGDSRSETLAQCAMLDALVLDTVMEDRTGHGQRDIRHWLDLMGGQNLHRDGAEMLEIG